jgi:hypothetical protein
LGTYSKTILQPNKEQNNKTMNCDKYRNVTFFYVVGGEDRHYNNFFRSIKSVKERLTGNPRISVLEVGNRLNRSDYYQLINNVKVPECINGSYYWLQKYIICNLIDTEFGLYLDSDVVIVNDVLEDYIRNCKKGFGSTISSYVKNVKGYFNTRKVSEEYKQTKMNQLDLLESDPYFTAGVFLFKNTNTSSKIISRTLYLHHEHCVDIDLIDELYLSSALKKYGCDSFPGSFNHTCSIIVEDKMPLELRNGILHGKNYFEEIVTPIFTFHCDTHRRNPADGWNAGVQQKVRESFYL